MTRSNAPASKRPYFATVPPQEILPIVDARYESSVSGIFVIGDVTGLPLVKIAANQGADVIERMKQFAKQSHDPVRPGSYKDRARHEKDRRAKWGTSRQPARK